MDQTVTLIDYKNGQEEKDYIYSWDMLNDGVFDSSGEGLGLGWNARRRVRVTIFPSPKPSWTPPR